MNMKRKLLGIAALALTIVFASPSASALPFTQTTGTVTVTATTVPSVSLTFETDDVGIGLGGNGTSAATIGFGTLQAFGGPTLPNGVTFIPPNSASYGVSTPFDVVVAVANQESPNYTLTAALQIIDNINTWTLANTTLGIEPATLTATGGYGRTPYTLTLSIPLTAGTQNISNTITFVALAN